MIKGWEILPSFPVYDKYTHLSFSRDVINHIKYVTYGHRFDEYFMLVLTCYGLWVKFELNFIEHNDLEDIRKSYIHGNKYHS
jgi:hypothetical protein